MRCVRDRWRPVAALPLMLAAAGCIPAGAEPAPLPPPPTAGIAVPPVPVIPATPVPVPAPVPADTRIASQPPANVPTNQPTISAIVDPAGMRISPLFGS